LQSTGIVNFCFVAHSLFPTIYQAMKNPLTDSKPALFMSYFIALVFYGSTGIFGYLTYGTSLIDPITKNIGMSRSGKPLHGLAFLNPLTNAAVTIKLESQFPLYSATILTALERWLHISPSSICYRRLLRLGFFSITTTIALLTQTKLAEIQAFTGCLFIMATCITLPSLFYLKLCWKEIGFGEKIWLIFLFILGCTVQLLGSLESLWYIIDVPTVWLNVSYKFFL